MIDEELIIKGNKGLGIFAAFMMTAVSGLIGYEMGNELFDWKHFNPAGWNTLLFLIVAVFTALCWIAVFRDLPRLKIDSRGIWKQRNFLSHSLKLVVTWDNISYYSSQVQPSQTIATENLVIRKKEPDEPVEVDITDSNISREEILRVLHSYSVRYGFNDFVEELN